MTQRVVLLVGCACVLLGAYVLVYMGAIGRGSIERAEVQSVGAYGLAILPPTYFGREWKVCRAIFYPLHMADRNWVRPDHWRQAVPAPSPLDYGLRPVKRKNEN